MFIKIPLEENHILIEIYDYDENHIDDRYRNISNQRISDQLLNNFKDIIEKALIHIANILSDAMKSLKHTPYSSNIEFGISFDLEGNVIITKVSTNANFKVSIQWNNL